MFSTAMIPFVPVDLKAFAQAEAAKGVFYSKLAMAIALVAMNTRNCPRNPNLKKMSQHVTKIEIPERLVSHFEGLGQIVEQMTPHLGNLHEDLSEQLRTVMACMKVVEIMKRLAEMKRKFPDLFAEGE